jgi:hypothetical protein
MEEQERDHELGEEAERLVGQLEANLKYDETGKSYIEKSSVLNLVFRVADFIRKLSKRI